jgi:hypothetical protein
MAVLVLVAKQNGYVEYDENKMRVLEKNGQIECIAADYFDLYFCEDVEKLREAVVIGKVYVGKDVPDGRYVSAGGDEVYVLSGRVVTEEEFVKAKLGRRGLRALRNDAETLEDLLDPWTW